MRRLVLDRQRPRPSTSCWSATRRRTRRTASGGALAYVDLDGRRRATSALALVTAGWARAREYDGRYAREARYTAGAGAGAARGPRHLGPLRGALSRAGYCASTWTSYFALPPVVSVTVTVTP